MTIPLHDYPDWQRSLSTADYLDFAESTALASGADTSSSVVDMRPYQSFAIAVNPELSEAATDYGIVGIRCTWYRDAAMTEIVYEDGYMVLPGNPNGASFVVPETDFLLQDTVHGPFMDVSIKNYGPDDITVSWQVLGNTRPIPGPYVRQISDVDPSIHQPTSAVLLSEFSTLGAGNSEVWPMRMHIGPVYIRAEAELRNFTFRYVLPAGDEFELISVASGTVDRRTLIFPAESVRILVTNTGAGNGNYDLRVIAQRQTW